MAKRISPAELEVLKTKAALLEPALAVLTSIEKVVTGEMEADCNNTAIGTIWGLSTGFLASAKIMSSKASGPEDEEENGEEELVENRSIPTMNQVPGNA